MEKLVLENPIREFEISLFDVPEKVQQLDFFEPRDSTEDRWRRLISFAKQANCDMGFLQIQASHFPEKSFSDQNGLMAQPEDFGFNGPIKGREGKLTEADFMAKSDSTLQWQNEGKQIF